MKEAAVDAVTRGRGYTLLELVVVTAIIATLAAIAIPNLVESRRAANEVAALATVRSINGAQIIFRARDLDRDGRGDYAESVRELRGLLDERITKGDLAAPFAFGTSAAGGYYYGIKEADESIWSAEARPVLYGKSGVRTFHVDETGVIRYATTAVPTGDPRTWPPVGE